jgi:aminodeoxyfutalosine synthase
VALCRLHLPVPHLLVDFARLGHRLAQMALGFGADELFGPIVSERALRLGDNAGNPAMTRKEAATLIRGAGWTPFERVSGNALEAYEFAPPPAPIAAGGQQ